jgi:hypothetical protein
MVSGDVTVEVLFMIGVAALGFRTWRRGKRPRFITDERGERQRVDQWNRGQPVYDPKTWQQRIQEEAILRRKRRRALLASVPMAVLFIVPGLWVLATFGIFGAYVGLGLLLGGAVVLLKFVLPPLFMELLYLSGYQGMDGAKVLDRPPVTQPGREIVETQKAHGDARFAGEAEALDLLKAKR